LPIHNGTFGLAMHAWHEPFERITPSPAPIASRWRHRHHQTQQ
jgi:hypothetical protein